MIICFPNVNYQANFCQIIHIHISCLWSFMLSSPVCQYPYLYKWTSPTCNWSRRCSVVLNDMSVGIIAEEKWLNLLSDKNLWSLFFQSWSIPWWLCLFHVSLLGIFCLISWIVDSIETGNMRRKGQRGAIYNKDPCLELNQRLRNILVHIKAARPPWHLLFSISILFL